MDLKGDIMAVGREGIMMVGMRPGTDRKDNIWM